MTVRERPSRWSAQRRRRLHVRRPGLSLFEILFGLSMSAVLFALLAGVLIQSMETVRIAKHQLRETLMLRDLSDRFRDFTHGASSYSLEPQAAEFSQPNGDLLRVRIESDRVHLTTESGGKQLRQETYRFDKVKNYSLAIRTLRGIRFAELRMNGSVSTNRATPAYQCTLMGAMDPAANARENETNDETFANEVTAP